MIYFFVCLLCLSFHFYFIYFIFFIQFVLFSVSYFVVFCFVFFVIFILLFFAYFILLFFYEWKNLHTRREPERKKEKKDEGDQTKTPHSQYLLHTTFNIIYIYTTYITGGREKERWLFYFIFIYLLHFSHFSFGFPFYSSVAFWFSHSKQLLDITESGVWQIARVFPVVILFHFFTCSVTRWIIFQFKILCVGLME